MCPPERSSLDTPCKLLIDSINSVDRPVIVAYLILTTVLFVFINFVVDLLYTVIDPRIKIR